MDRQTPRDWVHHFTTHGPARIWHAFSVKVTLLDSDGRTFDSVEARGDRNCGTRRAHPHVAL